MNKFMTFLHQNLFFVAVLILIIIIYIIFEFKQRGRGARCLSPKMAAALMNEENTTVIDVRPKDQFVTGHIVGSKNIDVGTLQDTRQLPKDKTAAILLVCERGVSAKGAVARLRQQGYTNIAILEGGLVAWRRENFPVVSKAKK